MVNTNKECMKLSLNFVRDGFKYYLSPFEYNKLSNTIEFIKCFIDIFY